MPRAKTTDSSELDLPVQAAVEQPIINSPFQEPKFWWNYDKSGKAIKTEGRRKASYFWTTQKVMSDQKQLSLEGMESDYGSEELGLVNDLREDVRRWRASGYENATATTKKLLAHWKSPDRKRALFFCQLEAVETIIYINEVLGVSHLYVPDFLVRLSNQVCLILEVKGFMNAQDEAKAKAAQRWVSAVNHWGQMGKWAYHVNKDPAVLSSELKSLSRVTDVAR